MSLMGERIRSKRKEKDLTLEELGKMLGVFPSAVNKWENGTVENIKRSTIQQMADIFGCSPAWLMGFDAPEINSKDIESSLVDMNIPQLRRIAKYAEWLISAKEEEEENNAYHARWNR